jgi:hypothetical protein
VPLLSDRQHRSPPGQNKVGPEKQTADCKNRPTWPFVAVIFFGIFIMWLFPQIVLILPQLMQ